MAAVQTLAISSKGSKLKRYIGRILLIQFCLFQFAILLVHGVAFCWGVGEYKLENNTTIQDMYHIHNYCTVWAPC